MFRGLMTELRTAQRGSHGDESGIGDDLWFEAVRGDGFEHVGIFSETLRHLEAPLVADLAAMVEIDHILGNEETLFMFRDGMRNIRWGLRLCPGRKRSRMRTSRT